MRKIKFIGLIIVAVALFGCKKPLTECQQENIGYMAFENNSKDAYDIFINNSYLMQMPGNSYTKHYNPFPAGKAYKIVVQQVSGYIVYPTVKTYNITLNQCDQKDVIFPN